MIIKGNVEAATLFFKETENAVFFEEEPYTNVDAQEAILIDPHQSLLYVKIMLDGPVRLDTGAIPANYNVTHLEIYGCFTPGMKKIF